MKSNLEFRPPATRRPLLFSRKSARLLAALLLPTLAMCLAPAGPACPTHKPAPWVAKDWTQWTSDDCGQVLNDSPWALKNLVYLPSAGPGSAYRLTIVQLRSALPIRQALLRQLQLQKRYDKMNAQKKKEFDQQHAADLNGTADANVVVVIENSSTEPGPDTGNIHAPGQPFTLFGPDPARQAALQLSDGTLVLPIQTTKVKYASTSIDEALNQFEYLFPRSAGGKPLFSADDSNLWIRLGDPLIVDKKTGNLEQHKFRISGPGFTFKIADLIYKGKLEY